MNPPLPDDPTASSPDADRRLRELAFLNEIAQLATLARDWDELMRSIVDGTTAAMGVEVCSFYLADHEGMRLTLSATNGLDRAQVGRISLAWGQGITGRVAAGRTPIAVEDVTVDDRFAWVRGFDVETLRGMLSVPLEWHGTVVGVLNVQTRERRRFDDGRDRLPPDDRRAAGGDRREGPADGRGRGPARPADRARRGAGGAAQRRHPRAADAAVGRARLRGPARRGRPRRSRRSGRGRVARRGIDQLGRLDRLVDSILASVRGEGLTGLSRAPFDAVQAVDETVETLRLLLRRTRSAGTGRPSR